MFIFPSRCFRIKCSFKSIFHLEMVKCSAHWKPIVFSQSSLIFFFFLFCVSVRLSSFKWVLLFSTYSVTFTFILLFIYWLVSPCLRLHAGYGTLPAGADPPPHPMSVWQKSPGTLHCLLDPESLCTLGGFPAPRLLPQTPYDRAS